jgi:hypothetical protein
MLIGGVVPSETKLVGSWQYDTMCATTVDTYESDHTFWTFVDFGDDHWIDRWGTWQFAHGELVLEVNYPPLTAHEAKAYPNLANRPRHIRETIVAIDSHPMKMKPDFVYKRCARPRKPSNHSTERTADH